MALYEHIFLARQDVSPQQVEEMTNALTEVITQPTVAGIILYNVLDVRDIAKRAAKNDARAKQAQMETTTKTATLTSLLLGF